MSDKYVTDTVVDGCCRWRLPHWKDAAVPPIQGPGLALTVQQTRTAAVIGVAAIMSGSDAMPQSLSMFDIAATSHELRHAGSSTQAASFPQNETL